MPLIAYRTVNGWQYGSSSMKDFWDRLEHAHHVYGPPHPALSLPAWCDLAARRQTGEGAGNLSRRTST